MTDNARRRYRAGDSVEDLCRSCKVLRTHTVMAADADGRIVRVVCGYCNSHHNYRGGEEALRRDAQRASREEATGESAGGPATARPMTSHVPPAPRLPSQAPRSSGVDVDAGARLPLVSERERRYRTMGLDEGEHSIDLETMLRRVLREEMGLAPVVPAEKWRGGDLVLRPGKPGLQEKTWPIETFLHKIVMLRNRLRVLEQQINGMSIPADEKVKLQSYITGCYGTLTSFNILFASEEDRFHGSGGGGDD